MKILLTGFNSFRGVRVNPSERVVRTLASRGREFVGLELITAVLPTEYTAATRQLRSLIRSARPDAILCLGVAARRESISLERVALNLDDDATPDNAGIVRQGRKIAPNGPDLYWTTLPLDRLREALHGHRIEAVISNHAGTFLCNHAFYIAQHESARSPRLIPSGFIHLPGDGRAGTGRGQAKRKYSLDQLTSAVECCLKVLQAEATRKRIKDGRRS
jgi:pyroglutamyl-peptidase